MEKVGPNSEKSTGPLIGSIIVVILLLAGGYYSLQKSSSLMRVEISQPAAVDISTQPVPIISPPATPPQVSTKIKDIEADANNVDVSSVDSGLENLDLLVK